MPVTGGAESVVVVVGVAGAGVVAGAIVTVGAGVVVFIGVTVVDLLGNKLLSEAGNNDSTLLSAAAKTKPVKQHPIPVRRVLIKNFFIASLSKVHWYYCC